MRLPNDDSLYRVDSRWLGPRGWHLPWAARYSAYGIGFFVLLGVLAVFHRVGIPFNPLTAAWALGVTVAIITLLHRRIDAERPVRTVWQGFVQEVSADRPPAPVVAVLRLPPVRGRR